MEYLHCRCKLNCDIATLKIKNLGNLRTGKQNKGKSNYAINNDYKHGT